MQRGKLCNRSSNKPARNMPWPVGGEIVVKGAWTGVTDLAGFTLAKKHN